MLTVARLLFMLFSHPGVLLLRTKAVLQHAHTVGMGLHWKSTMGEKSHATNPTDRQDCNRE